MRTVYREDELIGRQAAASRRHVCRLRLGVLLPIAALPAWYLSPLHLRTARLLVTLVGHAPSLRVPRQEIPRRKRRSPSDPTRRGVAASCLSPAAVICRRERHARAESWAGGRCEVGAHGGDTVGARSETRRRGLLAPNRLGAQRAARGFWGRSEPSRRRETLCRDAAAHRVSTPCEGGAAGDTASGAPRTGEARRVVSAWSPTPRRSRRACGTPRSCRPSPAPPRDGSAA